MHLHLLCFHFARGFRREYANAYDNSPGNHWKIFAKRRLRCDFRFFNTTPMQRRYIVSPVDPNSLNYKIVAKRCRTSVIIVDIVTISCRLSLVVTIWSRRDVFSDPTNQIIFRQFTVSNSSTDAREYRRKSVSVCQTNTVSALVPINSLFIRNYFARIVLKCSSVYCYANRAKLW